MKTKYATSPLAGEATPHADAATFESRTYAKVVRRLIPFLMLCYLGAYLDRVNVGFAKLQMLSDLHFSETIYGLAPASSSSATSSSKCRAMSSCTRSAPSAGSHASC